MVQYDYIMFLDLMQMIVEITDYQLIYQICLHNLR